MSDRERSFLLRTLGIPVLNDSQGEPVRGLRRKDLALLAYLCVERRTHSRDWLAELLWSESTKPDGARASLTQAIYRINKATDELALVKDRHSVRPTGAVACDAEWLLAGDDRLDPLLDFYEAPFLEGFDFKEFNHWADRRRTELSNAALRWLERVGAAAEAAGNWSLAEQIGVRGTQIDPLSEQAVRRVMRARFAKGERNAALRHLRDFTEWLFLVYGDIPDDETLALAAKIRAARDEARSPPPPPPPPVVMEIEEEAESDEVTASVETPELASEPPKAASEPEPAPPGAEAAAPGQPAETQPEPPPPSSEPEAPTEPEVTTGPWAFPGAEAPATAARPQRRTLREKRRRALVGVLLAMTVVLLVWTVALLAPAEPLPARGEVIRTWGGPVYLAYAETLWRYPDEATLERCLGGWMQRIRRVRRLPPWPKRTLLSVTRHPWQGGLGAVVADHPPSTTQYVAVGCVLAPIPEPLTFRAIFGHTDVSRSSTEPDSLIRASPQAREAHPYPVRRAGTLIQGAEGEVKWVVFHGGALTVEPGVLAGYCRTPREVVRVPDAEFEYYRAFARLPPADPPCRRGENERTPPRPVQAAAAKWQVLCPLIARVSRRRRRRRRRPGEAPSRRSGGRRRCRGGRSRSPPAGRCCAPSPRGG